MKKVGRLLLVFLFCNMIMLTISYGDDKKSVDINNIVKSVNEAKQEDIELINYMYKDLEESILKSKNQLSIQSFVDEYLSSFAGKGAEWYVIIFYKMYGDKIDYTKYLDSLNKYVNTAKKINMTTKQLIGLTYLCIDKNNKYIDTVCDETIDKQGIMTLVFGLHLLNNKVHSNSWTKEKVIDKLLNAFDENNAYGYMGNDTDIDVTSMIIQALSPYYNADVKIKYVIDKSIDIISKKQEDDGTFLNGGQKNSESISQLILMASTLKADIANDKRFIKNSKNLYDILLRFRTSNGLYAHLMGGDDNSLSTQQALYSLGSMLLSKNNNDNLFNIR